MARLRWASGIALVALTVTACGMGGATGTGQSGEEGEPGGGHLVYAEQFAPASAWATETNDAHSLMRAGCLETLIQYSNEGELEPMLATEWNQVEPTAWEFTLRDDVTFQDGTPMDGEAVAGALTHVLEVETPARAFNPDGRVRRGGDRRDDRADHHAGSRSPRPAAGGQPERRDPGPRGVRRRGRSTSRAPAPGPFTVTDEAPGSRSPSRRTRTTGVARSASRPPRCGSSSTVPPGPRSWRPVRRRSPRPPGREPQHRRG